MTLDSLYIEDTQDVFSTAREAVREIRQMAIEAIFVARRTLAGATLMTMFLGTFQQSASAFPVEASQPQEIIIDNAKPVPFAIDALVAFRQHQRLLERINELKNVPANWDGAGAYAPSAKALLQVKQIVKGFSESILSYCALFPSADSSLLLQARFPKGNMIVDVSDGTMSYVMKNQEVKHIDGPIMGTSESILHLRSLIEKYYL